MNVETIIKVAGVVVALIVGAGAYFVGPFKKTPDNPIEETAEEYIYEETGMNIDITPLSKEDDVSKK